MTINPAVWYKRIFFGSKGFFWTAVAIGIAAGVIVVLNWVLSERSVDALVICSAIAGPVYWLIVVPVAWTRYERELKSPAAPVASRIS